MLAIILGTRAEIIKLTPVIQACDEQNIPYSLIHTGQHRTDLLSDMFFEEFNLSTPNYNLQVISKHGGIQTSQIMLHASKTLKKLDPDYVLVQGDTNSSLAGALAAVKSKYKLAHLESGLRNFHRYLPEETNRKIIDHCSTILFAPTQTAVSNLLRENIFRRRVFMVGNTIVDMVQKYRTETDGLNKTHFLLTLHRQETIDDKTVFENIMKGLRMVQKTFRFPIIYPAHPRAQRNIKRFKINVGDITVIDPVGYKDFLRLEETAELIFTDSGGVQEEACILGVSCVTLRTCTERPETVNLGANIVAGINPQSIWSCSNKIVVQRGWKHPYGDGTAGQKTVKILGSMINA